jgi:ribosomal protein S18 acetylase RimI-like enzyme
MRLPAQIARLRDGRSVTLRSPDAADAPATLDFLRQLARESSRNLNHPPSFFAGITVEAQASFLEATAAHARNLLIAAWLDEVVVGNANLAVEGATFSAHAAQLGLGVLSPYRELGLGRLLTESLIATAEASGISHLTLRVRTFNAGAIRLYERLGFVRVGTLLGIARLPDGPADEHVYQRIATP